MESPPPCSDATGYLLLDGQLIKSWKIGKVPWEERWWLIAAISRFCRGPALLSAFFFFFLSKELLQEVLIEVLTGSCDSA